MRSPFAFMKTMGKEFQMIKTTDFRVMNFRVLLMEDTRVMFLEED